MSNTNPFNPRDTDFTNDQLTDLVLHKDDASIMENEEAVNRPEDMDENTLSDENADVFNQKGDSSACWFPIHFSYQGIDYSGDVKRMQATVTEYHVIDITPAIDHLPEPFVIAEDNDTEKFDFPVNEIYYPQTLGTAIVKAINDGSNDGLYLHSFEDDI
jgi:hypothetical protein